MPATNGGHAASRKLSFWRIPAPGSGELRSFGLLMGAVSIAAGGGLWYLQSMPEAAWAGGLAIWLLACAIFWQNLLQPLHLVWMLLARVLGFVNSHLLLALVFYSIFTAVGLVMRLVRYDPLRKTGFAAKESQVDGDQDRKSYWLKRENSLPAPEHFQRQF